MRDRVINCAVVLAAFWLLAGCGAGSDTGQASTNLAGRWVRPATVPGSSFTMTLAVSSQQVSGTGAYSIEAGQSGTFVVTGTSLGGTFNLMLTYSNSTNATYQGSTVGPNQMTGVVHQAGTTDYTLTLNRQ